MAALPTPALAQAWSTISSTPPGPTIHRQVDKIDDDTRRARDAGQLTRREARRLRRENGQIAVIAERYTAGGLSAAERAELQTRTEVQRDRVTIRRSHGKR